MLLKEEINKLNELAGVNLLSGKHLVVVDIQPEYISGFKYFLHDFINFLNTNHSQLQNLTFLYNGYDTLGMINIDEYKMWWEDEGLDSDIIYDADFYDKGYAFFRYCIDNSIDDDSIVDLVRFMIEKDVNDSRELDEEFWNEYIERFGNDELRELLEFAGDCINIPDLMDYLHRLDNIIICGGGINECLKEVEIALKALNKPFNVLTEFTY